MKTEIKVSKEVDYYNKVDIQIVCRRNIDEVDAKTIHEAANTILSTMEKYLPEKTTEEDV